MQVPDIQSIAIVSTILIGLLLLFVVLQGNQLRKHGSKRLLGFILILIFSSTLLLIPKLNLILTINPSVLSRIPAYESYLLSIFFYFTTAWFVRENKINRFLAFGGLFWFVLSIFINENLVQIPGTIFQSGANSILRSQFGWAAIVMGWGFFQCIAIILLIRTYHITQTPLHRNRYKFWVLITLISVIGTAFSILGQYYIGSVIIGVNAVFMTFISLNHQLPDIRQFMRKSLNFSLISVITVAVYSTAFIIVYSFPKQNPQAAIAGAILLAVLLVFTINPLVNLIQRWINRLVVGTTPDGLKLSGEYTRRISTILDLNSLATEIVQVTISELNLSYGELFIINKKQDVFILQLVNRLDAMPESTRRLYYLNETSPIAVNFNQEHETLFQYDFDLLPRYRSCTKEEKEWIGNLKMDVFIPIIASNEWIGLLAFGPKTNRDRYYDFEIELVKTFANQASIALQNSRLYENLKLRNSENECLNIELKTAINELSRLDQAKSDFISIASHEIRTPLTQIIGYNDILSDMIKGGSIQRGAGVQMVEGVRKAARRLEEIVDTMFDVSKLDTRTLDLIFSDTILSSVVSSAADKWRNAFEDRKLTFTMKKLSSLPHIQADDRRLIQVFSNLIQNAIKYTPDGGHIRITTKEDENSPYVELIVSDTGIGIEPEDAAKVFDKFYRVGNVMLHSSGDTKFKGAGPGLGLTIARGIVEAHGGKIWVESPIYEDEHFPGTAFHVQLPIQQPVFIEKTISDLPQADHADP